MDYMHPLDICRGMPHTGLTNGHMLIAYSFTTRHGAELLTLLIAAVLLCRNPGDITMKINGNHVAVKAVRSIRRTGGTLAKWIREAKDDEVMDVATFLLSDGLDVFPTGQDGQQTKQYKEFNVFRLSFRRENEGLTLRVDNKEQRVYISETLSKGPRTGEAAAKAANRQLSKANDTVVELVQNRDETDRALVIARQARRLGLTLDDIAEAFAKLDAEEADKEAEKAEAVA